MKRQTIAVDIDDVLAASADAWVAYSNQKWGTNLTVDDYQEDWATMWGIDHHEMLERAHHLHTTGVVATFTPHEEARAVLHKLAERYRLIITSSRNSLTKQDTLDWLAKHFGDVFEEMHLTGFYDKGQRSGLYQTKVELLTELGADFLIDDHPKHCFAAAAAGIPAVLFGDYSWNRDIGNLPTGVVRAANWSQVLDYFNEQ